MFWAWEPSCCKNSLSHVKFPIVNNDAIAFKVSFLPKHCPISCRYYHVTNTPAITTFSLSSHPVPSMADKYLLRVTAGPSYDPSTHQIVNVNTPHPTNISSPLCKASISVRIQNYRGTSRNPIIFLPIKPLLTPISNHRPPPQLPHHIPLLLSAPTHPRPILHFLLPPTTHVHPRRLPRLRKRFRPPRP